MNFDLSCLLGLDHVFLPTISYWMEDQRGVFQLFLPNTEPIRSKQIGSIPLFFSHYVGCALSILLFTIKDLPAKNFFWVKSSSGRYKIGMWDTEHAYDNDLFYIKKNTQGLVIPFSWIGWDHPLYRFQCESTKCPLFSRLGSLWKERKKDVEMYFASPFCTTFLYDRETKSFFDRLDALIEVIDSETTLCMSSLHRAVLPEYSILEEMAKELFPKESPAEALFYLSGNPLRLLRQFPEKDLPAYMEWMDAFFLSLPPERKKE